MVAMNFGQRVATPNSFGVERIRMKNKRVHFNIPGHAHELTFSCYKNRKFLLDERTCQFLADAVDLARKKHQLKIWAYVFMPDHVHLLIYPENDDYSISAILLTIKQSAARRVLIHARRHDQERLERFAAGQKSRKYRFWQDGGGYDRNIKSRDSLLKSIDYIHNNPVRKGLARTPAEWIWSSLNDWNGSANGPIFIDRDSVHVF